MTGYNRMKAQDARRTPFLAERIQNNALIEVVLNDHPGAVERAARRQREWCSDHSEPRVVCGCDAE